MDLELYETSSLLCFAVLQKILMASACDGRFSRVAILVHQVLFTAFPLKFLTASCIYSLVFYICIDVEFIRSFLDAEADKLQTLMARYFHAFKIAWANEDCFVCM